MLSTRYQWFAGAHLLDPYLTQLLGAFSLTLTTLALYQRSLRRFGTCPCGPIPRGLPSSPAQHRTRAFVAHYGRDSGMGFGGSRLFVSRFRGKLKKTVNLTVCQLLVTCDGEVVRSSLSHDKLYQRAIKRLFFVILSAAKNLSFKAAEILHSAALRSE